MTETRTWIVTECKPGHWEREVERTADRQEAESYANLENLASDCYVYRVRAVEAGSEPFMG